MPLPRESVTRRDLNEEWKSGPTREPEREDERILRVYRGYDASARERWNPLNLGNRCIDSDRWDTLCALLATHGYLPLRDRRIIDIGCGSGKILGTLLGLGAQAAHCVGVDLIPERILEARAAQPAIRFIQGNADHLEFPDGTFDLALASTVFSSILNDGDRVAGEIARVLKPGGALLWYDFRYRNPRNPHVRGMPKTRVRALFPGFAVHLRTTTVLPPLARRLGRWTATLYPVLSWIPMLRTHYVGLLIKPPVDHPEAL
jgi:ubiquinone/menaquinone biosynthesis C-methylase UbiE